MVRPTLRGFSDAPMTATERGTKNMSSDECRKCAMSEDGSPGRGLGLVNVIGYLLSTKNAVNASATTLPGTALRSTASQLVKASF